MKTRRNVWAKLTPPTQFLSETPLFSLKILQPLGYYSVYIVQYCAIILGRKYFRRYLLLKKVKNIVALRTQNSLVFFSFLLPSFFFWLPAFFSTVWIVFHGPNGPLFSLFSLYASFFAWFGIRRRVKRRRVWARIFFATDRGINRASGAVGPPK